MKECALQYAKRGWKVLPLKARAKTPLTRHGVKDASADPTQIETWWSNWPDANIGIATGNGLVVLDIDAKNSGHESLAAIQKEFSPLPETPTVETGGGGLHFYFSTTEDFGNRAGVRPGIDVRGRGGYVVAPRSIHENGKEYTWKKS